MKFAPCSAKFIERRDVHDWKKKARGIVVDRDAAAKVA
jgi:hypothetical protein